MTIVKKKSAQKKNRTSFSGVETTRPQANPSQQEPRLEISGLTYLICAVTSFFRVQADAFSLQPNAARPAFQLIQD